MKRTFLDFEKTTDVTAEPAAGDIRLLVNNAGNPVARDEAGSDTEFSMDGHTHSEYAATTHNHDGTYATVGHTHSKTVGSLGTAVTALSLDMDGDDFQEITFTGDTSLTVVNAEAAIMKTIKLYVTASAVSILTFPATWRWESKPVSDQITVNPGEEYFVEIITRGTSVQARYALLET